MTEETLRGGPAPDTNIPLEGLQPRGKWAHKMDFFFSVAATLVNLGHFWFFPYLCYKNGGAAFLIPYLFSLIFLGIPLFFLETALGQYTSEGGATAWRKICPMFQGLGIASQLVVTYLNIQYIVVLAWTIFYLCNSFRSPLPWTTCDNWWNTVSCYTSFDKYANISSDESSSWDFSEGLNTTELILRENAPEFQFWRRRALRMSDDMSLSTLNWELTLCLLFAWVMCYFCIWKGIRFSGKVVYFTVTFPYLLLFILFIRGVSLPGAGDGLRYYLHPDITRLADPDVWSQAGLYVLYSHTVGMGVLTSLGSYNKYNNNCYRDCLVLCGLNSAASIFAGFAVFSVLGFLAHELGLSMEDVTDAGYALVFMTYPKALAMLPGSSFWAVLFFLTILFLGLDTQFVCVESLATAFTDLFPRQLRRPRARELLVLAISVASFLLGLPFVTQRGIVLFEMMGIYYTSGITLLFITCCETIVIGWVYGADRFYDNIEDMIGYRPFPGLKYCWLFITPLLLAILLQFELTRRLHPHFGYGHTPIIVGGLLSITPLMCIPVFIFITLCKNPENMTTSSSDLRQARPHQPILTLCNCTVFRARAQPSRRDDEHEKMVMVETRRV